MSNFFEQELCKLFGDGKIIESPQFVGRACLGTLGGDLRVRAEFVKMGVANQYEALRLTVLNRRDGEVDRLILRIGEVIGPKNVPALSDGTPPHIWTNNGQARWFAYQPTEADYQALRRAAGNYLDVFRERVPDRTRPAPAQSSKRKSGRKAAIER